MDERNMTEQKEMLTMDKTDEQDADGVLTHLMKKSVISKRSITEQSFFEHNRYPLKIMGIVVVLTVVCIWFCLLMRYCCQLAQDTSSTPDEIETRRQLRKKALNGKRSSVLAVAPSSSSTSIHSQRSVSMMMSDTLLNPNKFNKKANLQRLSRISEESSSLSTISKRPSNVGSVGAGSVRPHTVQDFRGRDRKLETIADTDDVELRRTSSI